MSKFNCLTFRNVTTLLSTWEKPEMKWAMSFDVNNNNKNK